MVKIGPTSSNEPWLIELRYCIKLIKTYGNENVPNSKVASYIRLQASTAAEEDQYSITKAFDYAAIAIRSSNWDKARVILEEKLDNLERVKPKE